MKKISFWLFIFAFAAFTFGIARGQDTATQQQIDQINGRIQDIFGVLDKQGKRLDALEKSVGDLQDKLNQPAANNSASTDDLKKLAEQVKDLAKKQQDDNNLILKELEKLGKGGSISTTSHKPPAVSTDNSTTTAGGVQKGHYHEVQNGETLSAIAKAYSTELKIKLTVEQIEAANPGLNPKNLTVGKKIFIPDPAAK
jgi:septal ring factor EnvC (AmiA/AmiB activator)